MTCSENRLATHSRPIPVHRARSVRVAATKHVNAIIAESCVPTLANIILHQITHSEQEPLLQKLNITLPAKVAIQIWNCAKVQMQWL